MILATLHPQSLARYNSGWNHKNVKQKGELMAHLFETTGISYKQNITNPIQKADTCFFTLTDSVH
jgi:hypothetical protein